MSIKYIKKINEQPKIDVIIPAAGMGRRMKSYGPKPLIKIDDNLTILDHQLKVIKKILPHSNIILVCGFEADKLMNNSPDSLIKIYNESFEDSNVVKSIGMGLRASSNDVLVVYGDLVFNSFCLSSINYNKSSILVGEQLMNDQEVGCITNGKKLESMMYDLKEKWGQITFFKGRELRMLKKICWNPKNYNMFGFEAINMILEGNGNFLPCSHKNAKVLDIDNFKDLNKIREIV